MLQTVVLPAQRRAQQPYTLHPILDTPHPDIEIAEPTDAAQLAGLETRATDRLEAVEAAHTLAVERPEAIEQQHALFLKPLLLW